jgi:hypothetical protein
MHECSHCHGEKTVHCPHAMGREGGLWGFISVTVKNATERESALVLFAAGQASFRHRRNQPDPLGSPGAADEVTQ